MKVARLAGILKALRDPIRIYPLTQYNTSVLYGLASVSPSAENDVEDVLDDYLEAFLDR